MTFALTIPDDMLAEIYAQSGNYNRTKMCREMVALYQWVLEETCAGKQIIAEAPGGNAKTICMSSSIKNIQRRLQTLHHGTK